MYNFDPSQFLERLLNPLEIQNLTEVQLSSLAQEVRSRIIDTVSRNGGHLAPSLGVVELTLALLSEFDFAKDKLIWDVGHQTYAYKLLTGRAAKFHTLRKLGGLSGFPRLQESPYDHFGVGHSSTSISAALGMAYARDLLSLNHNIIAVIGDGSLTGGEAFEGLNLAGHMGTRLIVILNDNEMSISPNVGALSLFLSRTLSHRWVRHTRREGLKFLRSIPGIGQKLAVYAMRGEWSFKSFFTPGILFEALRFNYIGPVDGHDLTALKKNLQMAAAVEDGPVLLHVRTNKGKGYEPAEDNPTRYHAVGLFCPETGKELKQIDKPSFTKVFGETLVELAKNDPRIVAITAAMPEGTGTEFFHRKYPERFIDTGICEQHAVTFAAGLALNNYKPVVAIYSTFLQRAYDQIIHDVCLQNLPVTFCIDRAGLVGEDGATHHGMFDIAYMRHIPNMHIMAPRDEGMLRHCLNTAISLNAPCCIRYPRGAGYGVNISEPLKIQQKGAGEFLYGGDNIAVIAVGSRIHPSLKAAKKFENEFGWSPLVFDPVWIKPFPERQLEEIFRKFNIIVIVEEGILAGGFSSSVLEYFNDKDLLNSKIIKRMGIEDHFVEHGTQHQLRKLENISSDDIYYLLVNLSKRFFNVK